VEVEVKLAEVQEVEAKIQACPLVLRDTALDFKESALYVVA